MPRPYETVLIFESTLDDGQVESKIDRFRKILSGGGDGGAVAVDLWGKRALAYPIQKKEQGIYAVLRYETEPDALQEFERVSRLDESVLRHLTIVNPVEPVAAPARERRDDDEDEE